MASFAHSDVHNYVSSSGVGQTAAGVSACGHHYEVGTAPDWEMARSAAFPQLASLVGDKNQCNPSSLQIGVVRP